MEYKNLFIRGTILNQNQLENYLETIATDHNLQNTSNKNTYPIPRLKENFEVITEVYQLLNEHIKLKIPIHPAVKHIWKKYYNPDNEFLFMQPNGNKMDYDYYFYHFQNNFEKLHPEVSDHTAHDTRHMFRNELLGIKDIIINSIVGHSNDDVGEDIYSHVSIEEKQEALKMVTYKEQKKLYIFASNK